MRIMFTGAMCLMITVLCALIMLDTAYADTRGVVTGNVVNVRASAEVNDTNRITQVPRGTEVDITGADGDFFRVNVGDLESVYISSDWIRVSNTRGDLVYGVTVYNIPRELGGYPIGTLYGGNFVVVTGEFYDWFKFYYAYGKAFVEATYVTIPDFVELPRARIPGAAGLGDEIADFALTLLGTRYVHGGMSRNGFDCSGFVSYVLLQFDITVYRRSADMARNGVHVNRSDLERGDLVFFATMGGGRISHVGIYKGSGYMVHAANQRSGVRISNIHNNYFAPRFVTARRVW